jgi:hypothetical protein
LLGYIAGLNIRWIVWMVEPIVEDAKLLMQARVNPEVGKGGIKPLGKWAWLRGGYICNLIEYYSTLEERIIWGDSEKGEWSYSPPHLVTGPVKQADRTDSKESLHFRLPFGVVELR